jgi:hypothetical protein
MGDTISHSKGFKSGSMLTNRNIIREFGSMRGETQDSLQRSHQADEQVIYLSGGTVPSTSTALQTWKEIASELNCGVRTAQRWERTLGLPVRRLGRRRCRVFAFKDELRHWLRNKPMAPKTQKVTLLRSITDFFAREHSSPKQICDHCHSPMQFLDGHFWIYGTSRKWNLSVPFCPLCDADGLEGLCCSQILH